MIEIEKLAFYKELECYYKQKCFSSEFSDVTIKIADELIPAHKIVMARNEVFYKMFSNSLLESKSNILEIIDCNVATFRTYLKYLYTGELIDDEKTIDLLILAEKYLDTKLKLLCEPKLCEDISVENSVNKLLTAIKYRCDMLKSKTSKFILKNYKPVLKSQHFKSMILDPNSLTAEFFNCIVKSSEPDNDFHLLCFDNMSHWIKNSNEENNFLFHSGENEWSLRLRHRRENDSKLRFQFINESNSTKSVDILLILVSYSTLKDDLILLECSNVIFEEKEEITFVTELMSKLLLSKAYRNAFYRDNVLRVKVKITLKKHLEFFWPVN